MTYFILAASAILAIIFIAGIISAIREKGRSDKGRVYLPGTFAWIGGICGGLFLIPTLIVLLTTDESPWLSFCFLCFSMLGGSLSLAHLNCRITFDQESFTHKNFLGIKRTYTYDQITGLKEGTHEDIFYMGRHFAMLDEYSVGAMEFEIMAKKRYQALNGGKPIPRVKPRMPDIFNGHVDGGAGLIVVYIGVTLLFLGLLGWLVADVYILPPSPEEDERMEVVFDRAAVRGDYLYLTPRTRAWRASRSAIWTGRWIRSPSRRSATAPPWSRSTPIAPSPRTRIPTIWWRRSWWETPSCSPLRTTNGSARTSIGL